MFIIEVKFTYHKINQLYMCSLVAFSIFTLLGNCHLYSRLLAPGHFYHIKPIKQSLFRPPPQPGNHQSTLSLNLPDVSHQRNHTVSGFLHLAALT